MLQTNTKYIDPPKPPKIGTAMIDPPKDRPDLFRILHLIRSIPNLFRCRVILALLILPTVSYGGWVSQHIGVEPPKIVPKGTRILPDKVVGKPGKLLILDAKGAKGDVLFDYDKTAFDTDSAEVDGRKLRLVMPAMTSQTQTFTVTMVSWDDKAYEKVIITLPGTDGPPTPDDPTITPPWAKSLMKTVADGFAALDKRVKALEGAKPPPVVDPFQAIVQAAYEKDGKPAKQASDLASLYKLSSRIVNDKTLFKVSDVRDKMHEAAQSLFGEKNGPTVLVNTRRALGDEFNRSIGGKTGDALTDATRALITAEFAKAQKALEGVQ